MRKQEKLLIKFIKLIGSKKIGALVNSAIYTDNSIPEFFFNYEYFNLAWGLQHYGYLLDPVKGYLYYYNDSKDWIYFSSIEKCSTNVFLGHEIDGFIDRKDLYKTINNSNKRIIEPIIYKFNINDIITDLYDSGFDHLSFGHDGGITSYSILIYNPINDEYSRKLLKTEGDQGMINRSSFTFELLSYFIYTNRPF